MEDGSVLALSTDNIAEEIAVGLYTDPEQIGWMTVMVNLSDLAAVGAEPLGILLSQNFPSDYPADRQEALQGGIVEACDTTGVCVLGGDTNTSGTLQMGGTAVGIIKSGPVITRRGIRPGDLLYVSGDMGKGAAYAFETLLGGASTPAYRPCARLAQGRIVRSFGSSCMDTSDGFFPSLCNLMEINNLGFTITCTFSEFTHPDARVVASKNAMPVWFFLAGPHGEYELIFTIPPENEFLFLRHAAGIQWQPLKIGFAAFVSIEGVYSMDGDLAPLDQIIPMVKRYGAIAMLDDAHGTGVLGQTGSGTAEHFGVEHEIELSMGTFSKSFAVTGGFVAGSKDAVNYMRFFARPYMFSAALPPASLAAVLAGIDVIENEPWLRERLFDIAKCKKNSSANMLHRWHRLGVEQ